MAALARKPGRGMKRAGAAGLAGAGDALRLPGLAGVAATLTLYEGCIVLCAWRSGARGPAGRAGAWTAGGRVAGGMHVRARGWRGELGGPQAALQGRHREGEAAWPPLQHAIGQQPITPGRPQR